MYYFWAFTLLVFYALLLMGGYVIYKEKFRKVSTIFASYIFVTAATLFFRIYASSGVHSYSGVFAAFAFSSCMNALMPVLALHLVVSLSSVEYKKVAVYIPLPFILALVFCVAIINGGFAREFYMSELGYMQVYRATPWATAFSFYYTAITVLIIYVCFLWYKKTKDELKKKQALFLLLANVLTLALGGFIYGYLNARHYEYASVYGVLLQVLTLVFYGFAIFRYRLLEPAKSIAAASVLSGMSEAFFLVDARTNTVLEVNDSARVLVNRSKAEIVEKSIADFAVFENADGKPMAENTGDYKGFLRNSGGTRVQVEMNISVIMNTKAGFEGYVLVANDVGEMLAFLERQKEKNRKLDETYKELKKRSLFLERFQSVAKGRRERHEELLGELRKLEKKPA